MGTSLDPDDHVELTDRPNGAFVAAMVSSALGCFVVGLSTVLCEVSDGIKGSLTWWGPAGPLTGKTGAGIILWIISWVALHASIGKKNVSFRMPWIATLVLLGLSLLMTFPPVFTAFASH
jgi:hypothetical protein